jgi:hypothetical protein
MKFESVAIASFPRSGNTWMRHLLYAATGIGSRYNLNPETGPAHHAAAIPEIEDLKAPFVKTHTRDAKQYQAAIHLIRHPCWAIASYFDYFDAFSSPVTNRREFVQVEAEGWVKHSEYWRLAQVCGIPIDYIRVRYEDLVSATFPSLVRVVRGFLDCKVTLEDLARAIDKCSLENLQIKGSPKFYPKGSYRKITDTLQPEEIETINRITEKERYHYQYQP